jgi:hypothetical protein
MSKAIAHYLAEKSECARWPLHVPDAKNIEQAVVIPACAEYEQLFDTLCCLEANPIEETWRTLIIVVVNHRIGAPDTIRNNNQQTLAKLADLSDSITIRLAVIDAASPGCELPEKDGVGLARKIGLDAGLRILHENGLPDAPLICLDADTLVSPDYLEALHRFFASPGRWAAVIDYAHPLDGPPREAAAIACYELFLRYHVLGLKSAASPYAFHAIGSAMACTAHAYAAVSGMNRRQAGEDFYFLQQLAKTGAVEHIRETVVRPSARPSQRVPFGTGMRVRRFLDGKEDEYLLYHPESYRILGVWLNTVENRLDDSADALLDTARNIAPPLAGFLEEQRFDVVWPRLQRNHPDPEARRRAFHGWFDGFKTIKFLHHLRDHGYPMQEMFGAFRTLLGDCQLPVELRPELCEDVFGQRGFLNFLRAL